MTDLVVAFDTSTPLAPVVVGRWSSQGAEVLAVNNDPGPASQASAELVDRITATLRMAGASAADVTIVACGRGPGTFTGTRVAIATGMGLALGRGVPLLTVSTLAVVAASAGATGRIRGTLDARRGEIYAGTYVLDPAAGQLVPDGAEVCTTPELALGVPGLDLAVGSGVDAHPLAPTMGGADIRRAGVVVTPQGLWVAVQAGLSQGRGAPAEQARAVYLRKSYAELGLNTPRRRAYHSPFVDSQ